VVAALTSYDVDASLSFRDPAIAAFSLLSDRPSLRVDWRKSRHCAIWPNFERKLRLRVESAPVRAF
jgi:hypothetical protein